MKLYICEKPSQGRDIARNLRCTQKHDGYMASADTIVTWCIGHLLEQQKPDAYEKDIKPWRRAILPIVPDKWKMAVVDRTKTQFKIVKELVKQADTIVIATDADREGDVIGREILDYCKYKGKVERLWLSALDDASIQKALKGIKPGESTYPLYQAGLGRQRADWLIGMNMTMATTSYFSQGQGVLSVGRVQTPTLQLIVNRDIQIEKFGSQDYYVLHARFKTADSEPFVTTWDIPASKAENGKCLKRSHCAMVAEKIQGVTGAVASFSEKSKSQSPPVCLSLSTLQKLASSKFGISAKETLNIAQSLYETHKATTYPRTDCGYLPESQFADAENILTTLKGVASHFSDVIESCDTRFKSPVWNDKKVTAHHGIIPTGNSKVDTAKMTSEEKQLYGLVCRYYIAQFLGNYEYAQRKVTVACANETFSATNNTPTRDGWKMVLSKIESEKKDDNDTGSIPLLSIDAETTTCNTDVLTKKTKPPARYTEGTLIQAMKNIAKEIDDKALQKVLRDTAGIGTEATRANIIEILLKREFIRKDKKFLISTDKGRKFLEKLPNIVKDPATTAKWEQMLDEVAEGKVTLSTFLTEQEANLTTMLERLDKVAATQPRGNVDAEHQCPECKSALHRRKGKNGFFWGCTAYPNCSTTLPDENGKPGTRKPETVSAIDCPTCKAHKLVKRKGKKAFFWGCKGYPECKAIFWDKNNAPDFETEVKPQSSTKKRGSSGRSQKNIKGDV